MRSIVIVISLSHIHTFPTLLIFSNEHIVIARHKNPNYVMSFHINNLSLFFVWSPVSFTIFTKMPIFVVKHKNQIHLSYNMTLQNIRVPHVKLFHPFNPFSLLTPRSQLSICLSKGTLHERPPTQALHRHFAVSRAISLKLRQCLEPHPVPTFHTCGRRGKRELLLYLNVTAFTC